MLISNYYKTISDLSVMSNNITIDEPKRGRGRPPKAKPEPAPLVTTPSTTYKTATDVGVQPIQDMDEDMQLALALSQSEAKGDGEGMAVGADAAVWGYDEDLIQLRKAQEAADEEFARELSRQMEAEYNQPPRASSPETATNVTNATNHNDQVDTDAFYEELAKREANERLQRDGHAYSARLNVDRILAGEEKKEAEILAKIKRDAELKEWREERARQDAEYQTTLKQDSMAAATTATASASASYFTGEADKETEPASESEPEAEPESETLSKDDLRKARLAFFLNKQPAMN